MKAESGIEGVKSWSLAQMLTKADFIFRKLLILHLIL